MALVFALGAYGKSIAVGERTGFVMNFPAAGVECGGPSPREMSGMVVVDLDAAGVVKRIIQPRVIEVTSHVVTNVSDEPYRIRFSVEDFPDDVELEYHSRDKAWNPDTHEIERDIAPGESVDFGIIAHLPEELPGGLIPIDASVVVLNARNDQELSRLPLKFVRQGASAGGSCCE